MVITATTMRPRDWALPFWNSSQMNLPSPGFCDSISAAISTIQATPRDSRSPVKIIGTAAGSTILRTWANQLRRSTLLTLLRSGLTEATPTAVLITVGHIQHRATVISEVTKDFGTIGSGVSYTEATTSVTSGSQASGDTGLNTWISGLTALYRAPLRPMAMPRGIATTAATTKPLITVLRLVAIWV